MNTMDFDCPQFVCFESLQKEMRDSSMPLEDSLTEAELNVSSDFSATAVSLDTEDNSLLHTTGTTEKENFHANRFEQTIPAAKSKPKTTQPKPFQFETDSRIKNKATNVGSNYDEKDFASKLRQNTNNVNKPVKNRVTKVKPFNLTQSSKRKQDAEYVPLAEQVSAFHQKVPERYQTSSHKGFQPQEHWEPPSLEAKSPNLQTTKRRRVVTTISREEQELKEMKEYEFHARPVDPKIYKGPSKDETESKVKPKIKPKSVHLRTAQRAILQRRKTPEEKYKFKARPIPKDILNGPTGLKEKPVIPKTEPKAPAFQTDDRLEKRKILEQEKKTLEEEKKLQKKNLAKQQALAAKPPPVPFVPPKLTQIQPFSFDRVDQERFSKKEKKIQEELEEQRKPFVFRAQMMPIPEPSALPAVEKKAPTIPAPFNFELDHRSSKHDSQSLEEQHSSFKARSADVLKKMPFIPAKAPKTNLGTEEFQLYTEKRAAERQHLEELKKAEEREKERIIQEQKRIEEQKEQMELMRLRQELVHKANPIPDYKPVEIKPSEKPLTVPISPEFETDKRLAKKH